MPLPLKTGDILRGRYKVNKIIGQGGSGSIYLANDLRLIGLVIDGRSPTKLW